MFDTASPATRVTLTVLLAGAAALQLLMPLVGSDPALHGAAIGLFGFILGTVVVSIAWLLFAVPHADVPPATLNFMLLLATMGPGFAVLLTWLFGDDSGLAS
jgi:O-antigen/teichoic acid export membrane protein